VRAAASLQLSVTRAGKRLVSVGERGLVLLSDDDGRSWRQARQVPVSVALTQVRFVSDSSAGRWATAAWCCTALTAATPGSASSTA
jgi:photosystem II stability/assembly factor-like uncharacterized protein